LRPGGSRVHIMGAKLLVVDDDQDVRLVVEDTLVDAGYRVLQAEGGAQALLLLDEHPSLRVMISDVRMPDMSGIALAEEAVRRRPDLRVILISGFIDQVRPRWPFLRKPFLGSRLCDLVAREMRRA
jgi:DNA-binding NtrC family response regulator